MKGDERFLFLAVSIVVTAITAFLWLVPTVSEQIEIDRCLDLGGAWNSNTKQCDL